MLATKLVGRNAAALKYDVLSALMVYALEGDKHRQRSVLRLQSLITTRYNWQRNELSIGRREIARLWCVEERTVKREMSRFRTSGWITIKHAAARGRVAVYALDLEVLLTQTQPHWPQVGPDFVIRMETMLNPQAPPIPETNVVPFAAPQPGAQDVWGQAAGMLHAQDAQRYTAWFQQLSMDHIDEGTLILHAPTRFLAQYVAQHFGSELERLLRGIDPEINGLRIISPVS